jgi:hypothetical protein
MACLTAEMRRFLTVLALALHPAHAAAQAVQPVELSLATTSVIEVWCGPHVSIGNCPPPMITLTLTNRTAGPVTLRRGTIFWNKGLTGGATGFYFMDHAVGSGSAFRYRPVAAPKHDGPLTVSVVVENSEGTLVTVTTTTRVEYRVGP